MVDTVEGLVLEDQDEATEVDRPQVAHQEDLVDTMARVVRVGHHQEDTHLLVVMRAVVEDTVEGLVLEDLVVGTVDLKVVVLVDTHSLVVMTMR